VNKNIPNNGSQSGIANKKRLKMIGLTGGIGSGKSTVAEFFRSLHVTVRDADQITRDLVAPEQPAFKLIVERFGKEILDDKDKQNLNRAKLKNLIFRSDADRHWLENLLHPLAKQEILNLKNQIQPGEYWVIAIPLLVETHSETAVDRVLVVDCPEAQQIARVMKRDGLSKTDIEAIMKTQATREQRLSKADDIIINDAELSGLSDKVMELHEKYSLMAK
jgi:dephospho-CoA kinase